MPILGPQLLENSQCDVALLASGVQITLSSRFTFNAEGQFAVWQGAFQEAGDHLALVQYTANAPIRMSVPGVGSFSLPAAPEGGVKAIPFSVPDASAAILFNDLETASGALHGVELYRLLAA